MRHLVLIFFFVSITACATDPNLKRIVHQGEDILIELDKKEVSAHPPFEPPYHHPAQLSQSELEKILKSIKIQPSKGMLMSLFSDKGKEVEALFKPETLSFVALKFSEALAKADPEERINFYQTLPLSSSKVSATTGFLIVKGGRLHFRLNHYKVPLRKGRHPSNSGLGLKPTEKGKYAFDLLEGKQMKHRRFKNVIGLEGSDPQWLVIDYADFPEPVLESATTIESAMNLEDRLRTLKHLKEKGLITEEEYSEKKKSLLKDL